MSRRLIGFFCQIAGIAGTVVAVLLGWDLIVHEPAYSPTPERKQCAQNLDTIGQAFHIWANEHGGHFPFNVSSNAGGSMEVCARGPGGFDANAYCHFQVMSNQLGTPACLVCSEDRVRRFAAHFARLQANNVSYLLRSGPGLANDAQASAEELAKCPIHGYTLLADGYVKVVEAATDQSRLGEIQRNWRYNGKFRRGAVQVFASMLAGLVLFIVGGYLRRLTALPKASKTG